MLLLFCLFWLFSDEVDALCASVIVRMPQASKLDEPLGGKNPLDELAGCGGKPLDELAGCGGMPLDELAGCGGKPDELLGLGGGGGGGKLLLPLPLGGDGGLGGLGGTGPVPALAEHGPDVMRHWSVPFWTRM